MSDNPNQVASFVSPTRLLREVRAGFFRMLLCQPSSATIQSSFPGLGNATIRCQNVEYIADIAAYSTPIGTSEVLTISGSNWIHIESRLATAIVSRLLGMSPPILPRNLSRVERGILGCVVASFLNNWGMVSRLELRNSETPSLHPSQYGYLLQLHVNMSEMSGGVFCLLSPTMLEAAWRNGYLASLFLSRSVPLKIELARTVLNPADLAVMCVGDAILFEDIPGFSETDPWHVTLHFFDMELPAMLGSDGDLRLITTEALALEPPQERQVGVRVLPHPLCRDEDDFEANPKADQGAPVELVIEAAVPPLASDCLWSLLEGETISFGTSRSSRVQLQAGKISPVPGEVIAVDGMLAVRITKPWRALPSVDQTTLPLLTI